MGQRSTEPALGDNYDDQMDLEYLAHMEDPISSEPPARGNRRLTELRRRVEERLERKRMRQQLDYFVLD